MKLLLLALVVSGCGAVPTGSSCRYWAGTFPDLRLVVGSGTTPLVRLESARAEAKRRGLVPPIPLTVIECVP